MPALFFHLILLCIPPFIFPHYIYLNLLFEASVMSWGFQASRGWGKEQEPFGFCWQPVVAAALSLRQRHWGYHGSDPERLPWHLTVPEVCGQEHKPTHKAIK